MKNQKTTIMTEEVQMYLDDAQERMDGAVKHLEEELAKIHAGKASPAMLKDITVDYYGTRVPLNQVAAVGVKDARTIVVQPWEKSMLAVIEKEILKANLGFNPTNTGEVLFINVPELTEERRKQLVKLVKQEGEQAKIAIRNVRRDAIKDIKKLEKGDKDLDVKISEDESKEAQEKIQEYTDKYVEKVDKMIDSKTKELMTV